MAEMKDMYKLVRYVDSDKYDEAVKDKVLNHEQAMKKLVDLYVVKRRLRSGVLVDAIKHKYLEVLDANKDGKSYDIFIETTTKGRHFIAKKWFIYPAGLVDDSLKAYGRSQRFYLGLIGGGGIGAIISGVVTYILAHH